MHPEHALASKQMHCFSGMLSFVLLDSVNTELVKLLLKQLNVCATFLEPQPQLILVNYFLQNTYNYLYNHHTEVCLFTVHTDLPSTVCWVCGQLDSSKCTEAISPKKKCTRNTIE